MRDIEDSMGDNVVLFVLSLENTIVQSRVSKEEWCLKWL